MSGDETCQLILDCARNADGTMRPITFADTDVIEEAIKRTRARLVIFDPYQSYMPPGVDSHKAAETRPMPDGLAKLAERTSVAILIIVHLAKNSGGRAIHSILGSIDLAAAFDQC
jgi:predicted ATP-dependent serine protease